MNRRVAQLRLAETDEWIGRLVRLTKQRHPGIGDQAASRIAAAENPEAFTRRERFAAAAEGRANSSGRNGMAEEETMFTSKPKLDAWLHDQIQKRMKETGEGYRQAMNAVAHENPALMAVREGLYMQEGRRPINAKTYSLVNGKLVDIESQIERLIEAAKREHAGMDHNGAFRLVASEHRDLFQVRETLWGFIHG